MNLSLGNDANQNKLGACGGCEVVVKALKLDVVEKEVAKKACRAIWCLAMNNFANQINSKLMVVVKLSPNHLDENELLDMDAKQY